MPLSDYINTPARKPNNAMQREQTRKFGELEYFAELASSGYQDELSRLGTKVAGASIYHNPRLSSLARYVQPGIGAEYRGRHFAAEGKQPVMGTIYTGMGRSVPAVQSHEFRHAGAQYILSNFSREEMVKRWGKDAGMLRDLLNYKQEGSMEAFDDPSAPAGVGTMAETMEKDMKPEWVSLLKRITSDVSTDIMGDIGVPPRAKRLDR